MQVTKRDGRKEKVSFDKVIIRLENLAKKEPKIENIESIMIAQKVCSQIYDKVTTVELDELAAEICTSNISIHPDYGLLASRLVVSNNHKNTSPSFSECISILYNNNNNQKSLISERVYNIVINNKDKLNSIIDYERDYLIDYFGFKTLEKAYLFKKNNIIVERIQHMFMRTSLGIHHEDIKNVIKTYNYMSQKYFIHATPTLFHSGTSNPQLLSCFLLGMDDSVDSMYKVIGDCAKISKWAGGIGLWLHDIRAKNSLIKSTNGKSNGLMPLLKVLNDTATHINQSGRRNGSFAMYLELWHPDIFSFLDAKKNHGSEEDRARDLFYGVWINDLFMKKVKNNEDWCLFCPNKCNKLSNSYGIEFEKIYNEYEQQSNLIIEKISARKLWQKILVSQIETGTPYILFKDSCNKKSNQNNLGTIKSSNLCTEIIEYSSSEQYACCTLASIGLPKFVNLFDFKTINNIIIYSKKNCKFCDYSKNYIKSKNINIEEKIFNQVNIKELEKLLDDFDLNITENYSYPQIFMINNNNEKKYIGGFNELITFFKPTFDFNKLYDITKIITLNLNRIIDNNYYPVPETRYSNKLHRPLGIGVQGLSDVYSMFNLSFDDNQSYLLNKQIFATIYYASLQASMEIARDRKENMIKIKNYRETYGPFEKDFTKANQFININSNQFWSRGDINSIDFTKLNINKNEEIKNEMTYLHNDLLPIDEELFRENDKYLGAYSSFEGSQLSKGKFQFDLWDSEPLHEVPGLKLDWNTLRNNILEFGVRNSLCLAPMPTASTSQILGNNECIEPVTSNYYQRSTGAGSFPIINKYLFNLLLSLKLWNEDLKNEIIKSNGSIKNILKIPEIIRNIFKISWDLSQKVLIDQSADRGIYVCQSQSLNLFIQNPDFSKISSMHMYAWEKGLKTGIYYLRTKSKTHAQQFTIEPTCEACSA